MPDACGMYILSHETYPLHRLGRHTAFKWYNSGCRTLDDIFARKGGIKLSACQEIGLKHYAGTSTPPQTLPVPTSINNHLENRYQFEDAQKRSRRRIQHYQAHRLVLHGRHPIRTVWLTLASAEHRSETVHRDYG